jgi:hypothetical protein
VSTALIVRAALILALPTIGFLGGVQIFARLSGLQAVEKRLEEHAEEKDRKALYQRWGYDRCAVDRHWGSLDAGTRKVERRVLELDLLFPFVYGGACAVAFLLGWATLGRPVSPAWILLPVALLLAADWTENVALLNQLARYVPGDPESLQTTWVRAASLATTAKLTLLLAVVVSIPAMALAVLVHGAKEG